MKNLMAIIAVLLIASEAWGGQGSMGGSTWKTIGSVENTGKTTKLTWIEFRYEGYPGYYQRTLEETDCAKRLTRTLQGNTYTNEGTLVKSWIPKNIKPYYGYVAPIPGTPSEDIFKAVCGE